MGFIEHIRFRMRRAAAPAFILALIAYFAFHAISGNHGLLALRDLNAEFQVLKLEAAVTAGQRARLEADVSRMRRDNLDPALLDERARDVLGFARRDEVVIYNVQ